MASRGKLTISFVRCVPFQNNKSLKNGNGNGIKTKYFYLVYILLHFFSLWLPPPLRLYLLLRIEWKHVRTINKWNMCGSVLRVLVWRVVCVAPIFSLFVTLGGAWASVYSFYAFFSRHSLLLLSFLCSLVSLALRFSGFLLVSVGHTIQYVGGVSTQSWWLQISKRSERKHSHTDTRNSKLIEFGAKSATS